MKRSHVIVVVILIAVATSLFLGLGRKPQWKGTEIGVRFLGLTNDAAGTKPYSELLNPVLVTVWTGLVPEH